MWRIWNCVPRFVRQQFHGTRASAGVYVEEEKAEHETEKLVVIESPTVYAQEQHDAIDKESHPPESQSGRRGRPFCSRFKSWKSVHYEDAKAEADHEYSFKNRHHYQGRFWPGCGKSLESTDDKDAKDEADHEHSFKKRHHYQGRFWSGCGKSLESTDDKDAKDVSHQEPSLKRKQHCQGPFWSGFSTKDGTVPEYEQSDWWKGYCHRDFWSRFGSEHHALEAVTLGAALVFGLKLSRQPNIRDLIELWKDPDKHQQWRTLLYRVAFDAPPNTWWGSSSRSVVQGPLPKKEDSRPQSATDKTQGAQYNIGDSKVSDRDTEDKTLSDVMQEFESSCQQYAALASSVSGLYATDRGQLKSAVEHLQLACRLGHAPAYFNLAVCYEMGLGVEKDQKQAASYYRRAADVGHSQAIFNLALMTLRGEGGITQDKVKAMELLNKAATQGLAQAQVYLGVYYTEDGDKQQDFEQATSFFQAAASQNDAEGQYFLGICNENGWGVESSDEEAAKLYSAAAQLGHDGAMYNLAAFHQYGLGGIKLDEEEAMALYKRSMEHGNESAKFRLQEVEAKKVVRAWSEESCETERVQSPGLRRSLHSSSPTLTDHKHKSFIHFGGGDLSAWFSLQSLTSSSKSDDPQIAVFKLGGNEIDSEHDASDTEMNDYLIDISQQVGVPHSCSVGMLRTSTMPEMKMVSCQ